MRTRETILLSAAAAASALGAGAILREWRAARLAERLQTPPRDLVMSGELVEGLPEPAQRYLQHAIAPGTPIATSATLSMTGRMRPAPGVPFVSLEAHEVLAPPDGFIWRAKLRMNGMPVRVIDSYERGKGAVTVAPLWFVPLQRNSGADITRSTLGRMAGECVWVPSLLLPVMGAEWEAVDDTRAKVTVAVGASRIALHLTILDSGALREITMMRHGNVGVEYFQALPYGFRALREATWGGYTIPSHVEGGWWYGTARYAPDDAASFRVQDARFGGWR